MFENWTWRNRNVLRQVENLSTRPHLQPSPVCQRLNLATPICSSILHPSITGEIWRFGVRIWQRRGARESAEGDDRNKAEIYQINAGATSENEGKPVWSVRMTGLVAAPRAEPPRSSRRRSGGGGGGGKGITGGIEKERSAACEGLE